jgi:hypothetical protein
MILRFIPAASRGFAPSDTTFRPPQINAEGRITEIRISTSGKRCEIEKMRRISSPVGDILMITSAHPT